MLTPNRWHMELLIMQENFPQMVPCREGDQIGFQGRILFMGRRYLVAVVGSVSGYPQVEPRVFIEPRMEEHHWIRTTDPPYLCYARDTVWTPARSTFASCVAVAIRYLKKFGGKK